LHTIFINTILILVSTILTSPSCVAQLPKSFLFILVPRAQKYVAFDVGQACEALCLEDKEEVCACACGISFGKPRATITKLGHEP
jgi:hypothetical protein